MSTVIIYRITSRRIRKCNAGCYNAHGDVCHCICGGINHGVGLEKALENGHKVVEQLLQTKSVAGIQVGLPVVKEIIPIEVY